MRRQTYLMVLFAIFGNVISMSDKSLHGQSITNVESALELKELSDELVHSIPAFERIEFQLSEFGEEYTLVAIRRGDSFRVEQVSNTGSVEAILISDGIFYSLHKSRNGTSFVITGRNEFRGWTEQAPHPTGLYQVDAWEYKLARVFQKYMMNKCYFEPSIRGVAGVECVSVAPSADNSTVDVSFNWEPRAVPDKRWHSDRFRIQKKSMVPIERFIVSYVAPDFNTLSVIDYNEPAGTLRQVIDTKRSGEELHNIYKVSVTSYSVVDDAGPDGFRLEYFGLETPTNTKNTAPFWFFGFGILLACIVYFMIAFIRKPR